MVFTAQKKMIKVLNLARERRKRNVQKRKTKKRRKTNPF